MADAMTLSAEALRSRRYRERKRNLRAGNVEIGLWITPAQRSALAQLGFLSSGRCDDPDSVAGAVDELVTLAPGLADFLRSVTARITRAAQRSDG